MELKKDLVYQGIKYDIARGRYQVGEKLPREIDFAAERGVSFITMRSALKMLEHDGLIARIPSKGTFVLRRTPAPRPGKVRTILLLQVDYDAAANGGNIFNRDLILGAVEQAYLDGCRVQVDTFAEVRNLPERFAAGEFDGIIWDRPESDLAPLLEELREMGVAQVTINRFQDGIPALGCDYPEGVRAAMRYFRSIGHRHIGLIDIGRDGEVFRERQRAFLEELRFDGIAEAEKYLCRVVNGEIDYLGIAEWMRGIPRTTAVLVSNVYLAEFSRYLDAAGIAVPQQLSVIQQGEIENFSRDSNSRFSIFTDPRRTIGSRALVTVLRQLEGNSIPVKMERIVGELIIRCSCALPCHLQRREEAASGAELS